MARINRAEPRTAPATSVAARRKGLRPLRLWVPDTSQPGFAEECRRQSALVAGDPAERDVLNEIEAVSDHSGWQ